MKTNIYMLALMPPAQLASEIRSIQTIISKQYDTIEALKRPVHITLVPPYKAEAATEEIIQKEIAAWASFQIPFPVTLENYNVFRNRKPVLYIDVAKNDELAIFYETLDEKMRTKLPGIDIRRSEVFHPHVTVAFKDLSQEMFVQAEQEYLNKSFLSTFMADKLYFWKHNGKTWDVQGALPIGG